MKLFRSSRWVLLAAVTFGDGVPFARAADPPEAPAIAMAADILALGREEARRRSQLVRVEGVITFVTPDRPWFYVQDSSAGILILHNLPALKVTIGQKVDVTGRTLDGSFAPCIVADSITPGEMTPLPEPRRASSADVRSQKNFGQWVETGGLVRDAVFSPVHGGQLTLLLESRMGHCTAVIHGAEAGILTEDLREASVTARGVSWVQFEGELQVTGKENVVIQRRNGPKGFDRPLVDAASLPAPPPNDEPAHLRATCLFYDSLDRIYLRAADGTPVVAVALAPLERVKTTTAQLTHPDTALPVPGDEAELVGMAWPEDGIAIVRECQFRITASGRPIPPPVRTTAAAAGAPPAAGRLLTVEGVLVKYETRRLQPHRAPRRIVIIPVLTLHDGGATLEVYGPPGSEKELSKLPMEHLVEVTGYQLVLPGHPTHIWLRSTGDVIPRGRSRQAIMRMVWWGLGGLGALILTGGGFIWALREKLNRHRSEAVLLKTSQAEIRELNASLERRVAERTVELAEANERLTRASDEALAHLERERELGDLKSSFVSMVSHEFRTPLAVILSSTELLSNHLDRLTPERRAQQFASIRGSTQQMARLIEEVLLLGKVEAGRMTFTPAPVNLREFCSELVDEALSATARRCPMTLTCRADVPDSICADAALLRHIFSNLLSNAAKYSPEGAEVSLSAARENGHVVFRVTDKGIGIPEADLPRLFEPFHRARNVGHVSGTGLGLMITKRCVELHGGSISVSSVQGEGTTVTVKLRVEG